MTNLHRVAAGWPQPTLPTLPTRDKYMPTPPIPAPPPSTHGVGAGGWANQVPPMHVQNPQAAPALPSTPGSQGSYYPDHQAAWGGMNPHLLRSLLQRFQHELGAWAPFAYQQLDAGVPAQRVINMMRSPRGPWAGATWGSIVKGGPMIASSPATPTVSNGFLAYND